MSFTMQDFNRSFVKEHFPELTPEEQDQLFQSLPPEQQEKLVQSLPLEKRLADISPEEIRRYLEQQNASPQPEPRKRRKK